MLALSTVVDGVIGFIQSNHEVFAHFLESPFIVDLVLFIVMANTLDQLYPGVKLFYLSTHFQDHLLKVVHWHLQRKCHILHETLATGNYYIPCVYPYGENWKLLLQNYICKVHSNISKYYWDSQPLLYIYLVWKFCCLWQYCSQVLSSMNLLQTWKG